MPSRLARTVTPHTPRPPPPYRDGAPCVPRVAASSPASFPPRLTTTQLPLTCGWCHQPPQGTRTPELLVMLGALGWPGALQPPAPTDPGVTVSRHRALLTGRSARANPSPMREQVGCSIDHPSPPALEPREGSQPSVLPPSPAPQVDADAPQERIDHRPVEPAVVVHPPSHDGVQP